MTKAELGQLLQKIVGGGWSGLINQVQNAASDDAALTLVQQSPLAPLVQQLAAAVGPKAIPFSDFIQKIGDGLVKAQEKLDDQSQQYLTATSGKPHILPSIFRTPKISASMKFALDVREDSGLNLLFYAKRDQVESQNEQGIDFEVVNVPAPAGAAQQLQASGPEFDLLLSPGERADVLDMIQNATVVPIPPDGSPGDNTVVKAAGDSQLSTRLVVLSIVADLTKPTRYCIFHASKDADESVGLWLLTVGKPPTLETIYKFTAKNGDNEKPLRDIIFELGDRLATLFG